MPQNNYASLGLQQDPQGQFSPIAGFGIGATPSAEDISGMNWNERIGMMTSQMGQAQQQGQQANLGLLSQQLNEVGSLGAAGRQQITDVYGQERARSTQSLAARGLGSTTVTDAASAGIAGREQRARLGLEEGLTQQRLGVLNNANFQQPDMGSFYNQMMQAGSAGLGSDKAKQPPWWGGQALGAGLDMLGGGGGLFGGGGGGGGGGGLLGKLGGLFGGGGGGGVNAGYQGIQGGGFAGPAGMQQAGGGGMGLMSGLKGVLGGVGNFGMGAGQGIAGMLGFGSGTAGAGLGTAGAMGASLGPLAAIAGIGYLAYKNRKDIKRETKRIGKQVGKAGKKVKKWFKKIW